MRHPRQGGTTGLGTAVLAFLLLVLPGTAGAGAIEDLQGSWAAAPTAAPAMHWSGGGGGFTVAWTPQDGTTTTVQFQPTSRPNVYGGSAKDGWSIMGSMFGGDGPVNPLDGATLYWARSADEGIYLYRMQIDDKGGFTIDRYALRLAEGTLTVAGDRRTAEGAEQLPEQRLVRTAP
jgi:hypothetical protein